jgi:serine O-acetyltransferase
MFEYLLSDIQMLTQQERGWVATLGTVLFHPGLHSVILYRASRWFHLHRMTAVSLLINYLSSALTGAQISHRARIGKALVVYHPHGVVVGADAVLGEHCVLVHGVVIGQLHGGGDRPQIGDRLYAATGAKLLGRIRIGNNVRVGPNAVVTAALPDNVVVAGNPARIVGRRGAPHGAAAAKRAPAHASIARDAELIQRLAALIKRSLDGASASEVDAHTPLLGGGVGLDSLEVLRLINEIEEEFGLTIDEDALKPEHLTDVASLANFIKEQMSHAQRPRALRRAR